MKLASIVIIYILLYTVFGMAVIPNLYTGYTIDMTNGEPTNKLDNEISALKQPIVNLTFSNNIVQINGTYMLVPDQVNAISYSSIEKYSTTSIYITESDVTTSLVKTYSLGFGIKPFMFSQSQTMSEYQTNYNSYYRYTAETNLVITTYKATLIPKKLVFKSYWNNAINQLPLQFNSETCPKYKAFFKTYGTDLIIETLSGGNIYMLTTFSEDQIHQESINQINKDISTQFGLLINKNSLSASEKEELDQLNIIYSSDMKIAGGDITKIKTGNWVETISQSPILIKYNVIPLYEIVENKYKQVLKNATDAYYFSTITKGWEKVVPYPTNILSPACCNLGSDIYCANGNILYTNIESNIFTKFDSKTNTWVILASNLYPRSFGTLVCMKDRLEIVLFGGTDGNNKFVLQNEIYYIETNTWAAFSNVPSRNMNSEPSVTYFNGTIYYVDEVYSYYYDFSFNNWVVWKLQYIGIPYYICNSVTKMYAAFRVNMYTTLSTITTIDSNGNVGLEIATFPYHINYSSMGLYNDFYVMVLNSMYNINLDIGIVTFETNIPNGYYYGVATVGNKIHLIGGELGMTPTNFHYTYTTKPTTIWC